MHYSPFFQLSTEKQSVSVSDFAQGLSVESGVGVTDQTRE